MKKLKNVNGRLITIRLILFQVTPSFCALCLLNLFANDNSYRDTFFYCNIAIAMEQMFRLYLNLDSQYEVISNKIYFLYIQESRVLVTDIFYERSGFPLHESRKEYRVGNCVYLCYCTYEVLVRKIKASEKACGLTL